MAKNWSLLLSYLSHLSIHLFLSTIYRARPHAFFPLSLYYYRKGNAWILTTTCLKTIFLLFAIFGDLKISSMSCSSDHIETTHHQVATERPLENTISIKHYTWLRKREKHSINIANASTNPLLSVILGGFLTDNPGSKLCALRFHPHLIWGKCTRQQSNHDNNGTIIN